MSTRSSARVFDPRGTVRAQLGTPAPGPWFDRELASALAESDLGPGLLQQAWELAHLVPGLTPEEGSAVQLCVLLAMLSVRQGSTRLPLPGSGASRDESALIDELLGRLSIAPQRRAALDDLLVRVGAFATQALESRAPLGLLFGPPGGTTPFVVEDGYLYQQRMLSSEERLVSRLATRCLPEDDAHAGPEAAIGAALEDTFAHAPVIDGAPVLLSEEQRRAVEVALAAPLTLITGGPGTGKTSIVVTLLRALSRLGTAPGAIALAAPTGKAAHRLSESIRAALAALRAPSAEDRALADATPQPTTLHRLLGYSPGTDRFLHHANNPLGHAVVIVDECSMIDLALMDALVRATPSTTRLILLGDADQLPSVAAGAVFRDLVSVVARKEAGAARLARLGRSYRMDPRDPAGMSILAVGRQINRGATEGLFDTDEESADLLAPLIRTRQTAEELSFDGVELLDAESSGLERFLSRWYEDLVCGAADFDPGAVARSEYALGIDGFSAEDSARITRLLAHLGRFRILCITRGAGRSTGAEAINEWLHQRTLRDAGAGQPGGIDPGTRYYPGEPVMMQHNDYERGLFNGDQGVVLRVAHAAERHHFAAVFLVDGGLVAYPLDALREGLTHAYALTVHKAQGSEFDHVALVLPDGPIALATRELLYTGVTRSRRSVVIVGSRTVLERGIAARIVRSSGLRARLAARIGGSESR